MISPSKLDPARRRRMRAAERKLLEAQKRLRQAERSIVHWSRVLADLRYEKSCATQQPLWPEEDMNSPDQAGVDLSERVESAFAQHDG